MSSRLFSFRLIYPIHMVFHLHIPKTPRAASSKPNAWVLPSLFPFPCLRLNSVLLHPVLQESCQPSLALSFLLLSQYITKFCWLFLYKFKSFHSSCLSLYPILMNYHGLSCGRVATASWLGLPETYSLNWSKSIFKTHSTQVFSLLKSLEQRLDISNLAYKALGNLLTAAMLGLSPSSPLHSVLQLHHTASATQIHHTPSCHSLCIGCSLCLVHSSPFLVIA